MYYTCGTGTKDDPFDPKKHVAQREQAERKYWSRYPVYSPTVGDPVEPHLRAIAKERRKRSMH